MKGTSKMTRDMDTECSNGRMEDNMMDNGKMGNSMEEVYIDWLMEVSKWVNGLRARGFDG